MSEYLRRIDRAIDDLRQLLDALAEEVDERAARRNQPLPLDAQLCKDSLHALDTLLPKLEAAREAIAQPPDVATLESLAPRRSLADGPARD